MIIDLTLGTASIRKLKLENPISINARPACVRNNTNRGGCEVVEYDAQSASRGLSEARVAKADLLKQVSVVTKYRGGIPRIRKRRDGVSLRIAVVRPMNYLGVRWTDGVSDEENRMRELLGDVWGKPFDRSDGPSI